MNTYKKHNLESETILITQKIEGKSSIQFSIGVRSGSRYEKPDNNGISHLVEHIVSRNIREMLRENNWQGSYILSTFDAFTNKEFTKYYFEVEKNDLALAASIVSQILSPVFTKELLKAEKGIILEEIAEAEDDPQSIFEDNVAKRFFAGNSLAQGVLGVTAKIKKIDADQINQYLSDFYSSERIVIVATGKIDSDQLSKLLVRESSKNVSVNDKIGVVSFVRPQPGVTYISSKIEQTMVGWYFVSPQTGIKEGIKSTFFARVLDEYLNFYIRDTGFCYSLSASVTHFQEIGILEIYSSFSGNKVEEFTDRVKKCLDNFKQNFDDEALELAKENSVKALSIEADETSNLAGYLLDSFLLYGEVVTIYDVINVIKTLSRNDLETFYKQYLSYSGHLFIAGSKTTK